MATHSCFKAIACALCAAGLLASFSASAQTKAPPAAPALKRTELTRADVSVPGREAVVMKVELAPHGEAGRHTHPGDEMSYIMEGEGELLVDGEPPRRIKPGEAFVIKAGTVHNVRNEGKAPVRLIGVYHVEKGKPLATPVK